MGATYKFRVLFFFLTAFGWTLEAQPPICGDNPEMTSNCADACVICDIDGFTGVNNQSDPGQPFPEFCTGDFNKMQYIAFIAGSVDIEIEIVVTNCLTSWGLEVGFFKTDDCENFFPITDCDTDIPANTTQVFTNDEPLIIGQHYYLIMDGSNGATCDWTFNVLQGSTAVPLLPPTLPVTNDEFTCVDEQALFTTTPLEGAALYFWQVDGTQVTTTTSAQTFLTFPAPGFYEVCVSAANACDTAEPSCNTIQVYGPTVTTIDTLLCDGDCIEVVGNNLCITGFYEYMVQDIHGCDSTLMVDVTILPQPSEFIDINLCVGEFFQVGDEFYNTTGIHETTVLTAMECDSIVTLDLFMVECVIVGSTSSLPPVCNGEATGSLIFSVENGTPPFTYDYSNIIEPSINGTGSTVLFENNPIPNIPSGTYEINIMDNFGNVVVLFQDVVDPPVLENTLVPSDRNGTNVSCFEGSDGELTAFPNGGVPPYDYEWSESSTTSTAMNLSADVLYQVTVTDSQGCPIVSDFTLNSPALIVPDVLFTDPNCDGPETGIIDVLGTAGGVDPYLYGLDGNTFTAQTQYKSLSPGWNELFVQDANGCLVSIGDTLRVPDIPFIELGDEIEIDLGESAFLAPITNGSSLINISWENTGDRASIDCYDCLEVTATPYEDTRYTLEVTSVDDCMTVDDVMVRVKKIRDVYIANVFSPNNDGANDNFFIQGGKALAEIMNLQVYNRWGGLLFENSNHAPNVPAEGWDGKYDGKLVESGTYVYQLQVRFLDDAILNFKGDVTVTR